jgi:hypothetical protein
MHGEKYAELLKQLLSLTIQYCDVASMSEGIKEQLLVRNKCSPKSALQIDKSTDVAGSAKLHVFFRSSFEENIQEEFMFWLPLSERCTGSDIFKVV